MKLSLFEIELAVARKFGIRENIIVPNISWGFNCHECDLFIIKKSGFAVEIEIKRSINDLKADFKKKHNHKDNRIKELYYCVPEDIYDKCVNLIPINAGIIVVNKDGNGFWANIKRKAETRLNSRKLTADEQLSVARLGTMRIWSLKRNVISLSWRSNIRRNLRKIENNKTQLELKFKD
jgi:hypothetical protein